MTLNNPQLLVGDKARATCKKPKFKKDENMLVLERSAQCKLDEECSEPELKIIKIKFDTLCIIKHKTTEIITGKDLICEDVYVKSKVMKKVYDEHNGQDQVSPFPIERITAKPLRCYDARISGIPEIEATMVEYRAI